MSALSGYDLAANSLTIGISHSAASSFLCSASACGVPSAACGGASRG